MLPELRLGLTEAAGPVRDRSLTRPLIEGGEASELLRLLPLRVEVHASPTRRDHFAVGSAGTRTRFPPRRDGQAVEFGSATRDSSLSDLETERSILATFASPAHAVKS